MLKLFKTRKLRNIEARVAKWKTKIVQVKREKEYLIDRSYLIKPESFVRIMRELNIRELRLEKLIKLAGA